MPLADAPRTRAGVAAALAGMRAPRAFAMRGVGLLPEAASWTGEHLAAQLAPLKCHVLCAPSVSSRFTYFWGVGGDTLHSHYEAPPTVTSVGMSFAEFRRSAKTRRRDRGSGRATAGARTDRSGLDDETMLYLQTGLVQRRPSGELSEIAGLGPEMRALMARLSSAAGGGGEVDGEVQEPSAGTSAFDDDEPDAGAATPAGRAALAAAGKVGGSSSSSSSSSVEGCTAALPAEAAAIALIRGMVAEGNLGSYSRTAFFASSPGAVTRLHYDHYDNIYLQLRGHKRFVVFPPLEARGLYPFPLHHPLDQRARVHVDVAEQPLPSPTHAAAFPRLAATRGYEIDLGPGDVLYIPHHWWHHVETTSGDAAVDSLSLSLNLWFDFEPRLVDPALPLTPGLLLELARHVESWLGEAVGEKHIPEFLESCALELSACAPDPHVRGGDVGGRCAALEEVRKRADEANEATLPRGWLVARNLLFCELATSFLGWTGLRPFFQDLLYVGRFRGLVAVEPEMDPNYGSLEP